MEADILFGCLKQILHLLLCQPNGISIYLNLQFNLVIAAF